MWWIGQASTGLIYLKTGCQLWWNFPVLWRHFWFCRSRVLNVVVTSAVYSYTDIQWGKKVFSQPPIVQVLPLKKMREACNFHHRYTSTMRDKIRKKKSRKSHCRIFKEFICKLWWKISIWSITKFHLNTLLYTLCWQWQRSNVFCKSSVSFLQVTVTWMQCKSLWIKASKKKKKKKKKSSQGFYTLLLVFWPIPPCRSPLEQWCFGAVAGQHGLSTPSKDFLWGWDLETG